MRKVLIATTNPAKLDEIKKFLSGLPVEFVSLKDVGITQEVVENGTTYQENSQKKAVEYAKMSGLPTVSDDGGLEIDALDGAPGVHSHYWVDSLGNYDDIFEKMKAVAKELPRDNRKALFRAVVSFALPNGSVWSTTDTVEGLIKENDHLTPTMKGYPYRSFFYIPQIKKYYLESELTSDETKQYNHRYKALQKLKTRIKDVLELK
ncbi:MAG TPA: non-canonical purine NTP pyrophosphatase [Candidatus Eisenbacteria bacterium]|nr:non-canonical purine NTP pyrophosphatase [Candidatus Eisenbacteria bacterium]